MLVVDDAPENLTLMGGIFKGIYRVKVATGGEKALALAHAADPPDLILLDVEMPGMDGYEVCRRLKADDDTRDIPVIFLTGRSSEDDERRGLELGAADYLAKPVNPSIVLARTRNHLALKGLRDAQQRHFAELQREKERLELEQLRTEKLMLNIMPRSIAARLSRGEKNISGAYPDVTILFSDIVGFTSFASRQSATELVRMLNDLFTRFDRRAESLGLEKIKTIGDAWMAAGGLPIPRSDHAELCADMALGMFDDVQAFNRDFGMTLRLRVGLHSGPVVAGVIGYTKFLYDLWGHTVNVASRMESTAPPDHVQVSEATLALLPPERFSGISQGEVDCKGLGMVRTWVIERVEAAKSESL
ncbi:MAG TPA: adenylate/guanylate cyclase domain-containing protein [Ramlibacter sp.]|nr:adenylate/guanylate cyclase domain-containing protein [Ramlibacter sp.]